MDESRIRVSRSIPCRDAVQRDRSLEIVSEPGRIWLIAPPGGSAGVDPRRYEELKRALLDGLVVAVRDPS